MNSPSQKKIEELYKEHLRILEGGDRAEIAKIAAQHVLKLELGKDYEGFFIKHIAGGVKEELAKGIDARIIDLLNNPKDLPTFESCIRGKPSRKSPLCGLVEVVTHLAKDISAKTFVLRFDDKCQLNNSVYGHSFIRNLKSLVERTYFDYTNPDHALIRDIFKRLKPVDIRFADKGTLGITFINANNVLEEFEHNQAGLNDRLSYLKEISDINLAVGVLGNYFEDRLTRKPGIISRLKDYFSRPNLTRQSVIADEFWEKFYNRIDTKLTKKEIEGTKHAFELFFRGGSSRTSDEFGKPSEITYYENVPQPIMRFQEFIDAEVLNVIEDNDACYAQNDAIPTNQMVMHDKNLATNNGSDRIYSLIDFEVFGKSLLQRMFVDLWSNSGIHDYKGEPLSINGRSIEDELLSHALESYKALKRVAGKEPSIDDEKHFIDTYQKSKIQGNLLWAARFKKAANEARKRSLDENARKLDDGARYFYTLSLREMEKQGLIGKDKGLDALKLEYAHEIFGKPMQDAELLRTWSELNLKNRLSTVYHLQEPFGSHQKLEEMVEKYEKSLKKASLRKKAYLGLGLIGLTLLPVISKQLVSVVQRQRAENFLRDVYTNKSGFKIKPLDFEAAFIHKEAENDPYYKELERKHGTIPGLYIYLFNKMDLPGEKIVESAMKLGKENFENYLPPHIVTSITYSYLAVDDIGRMISMDKLEKLQKLREASAFGHYLELLETEKRYTETGMQRSAETIRQFRITDAYNKLARKYEQGKFSKNDLVSDAYIEAYCKGRVDPKLVKEIMKEINLWFNPFKDINTFNCLTTFINARLPRRVDNNDELPDNATPRYFFNSSVNSLETVLKLHDIDPLNPVKNKEDKKKLRNALAYYLLNEMEMDDVKAYSEKYGKSFADSTPSIISCWSSWIVGNCYGQDFGKDAF